MSNDGFRVIAQLEIVKIAWLFMEIQSETDGVGHLDMAVENLVQAQGREPRTGLWLLVLDSYTCERVLV